MEGKYSLTLKVNGNDFSNPVLSTGKRVSVKFIEAMVRFITDLGIRLLFFVRV